MVQFGSTFSSLTPLSDGSGTVLVVEDDLVTRHYLARTLCSNNYQVIETATGEDGIAQACARQPDVVLLDLGLPDVEGVDVVRRLREWTATPIIVLSLRGHERDKVAALDAGADDYLTKPFGVPELLARMRVAVRRAASNKGTKASLLRVGPLCIDFPRRKVMLNGVEVRLTRLEYDVLALLARNAGQIVTHRQLLQEVWGPQYLTETNYLRLYIKQLRDKLETDASHPRYLITEPGVGYCLVNDKHC